MKKNIVALLMALLLVPVVVLAEDDENEGGEGRARALQPAQINATWRQECGSCHIAYAPSLLPAESWRKLMAGLDQHFGSDASLTVAENQEITDFLTKNASKRGGAATASVRITETPWFKRQHNSREIPADVWQRASIKSASNCQACHVNADKGDFNEHAVKIPG